MPITSPSYFPPSRSNGSVIGLTAGRNVVGAKDFLGGQSAGDNSTVGSLIVIGDSAAKGGMTDALLVGSIAIGVNALQSSTISDSGAGPNTIIGTNAAKALRIGGGNVVLGDNAFAQAVGAAGNATLNNTVIGSGAASNLGAANTTNSTVIIGAKCVNGNGATINQSVFIGAFAGSNLGAAGGISTSASTVVGYNSGTQLGQSTQIIAIGANCITQGHRGDQNIAIGNNIVFPSTFPSSHGNIILGMNGTLPLNVTNCIAIGTGAGVSIPAGAGGHVAIEYWDGVTNINLIYGLIGGNLYLGNSAGGGRNLNGTNGVQIFNGVASTVNPAGGGYFYALAGALHWVGSSGTDTILAPA